MTALNKQALIAKIKKQTESFDTVVLKEGEANALVEALEAAEKRIAELEANKGKPVMFIDGDISASDAEKLAAVIREWDDAPAPVVPDEKPMPNPLKMYAIDAVAAIAEVRGWNACRSAMLQGTDGKPELTVWYGSMPETNGKTNWTAMLHRKGQHLWEGITIDRSEYPDRVRYEADRMRHLIGELPDEPDILSYDADAHSGYVKPGNSPVTPDGWIPVSERMPEREAEVQVYCADTKEQMVGYMERNEAEGWFRFASLPNGGGVYCKPTHWMPLPAAPQQEVNNG
ncbi:DUF551 domain-containing protein [Salmonella enterica subsp. enterica serovar Bovismorbificans]|nr:DUF551 domain-containing protein [Salmonella enterica subsp. enterica serovar Bovismorbificans]EGM9554474.1 DUF551 domain-containing protein [Salmonella enterica subsp. enterica serovar Bovismorbificans]EGN0144530.1 DUF551 domain-containing protein [Salmonella enterica subsp. enterica serovar Bovismorbificans]